MDSLTQFLLGASIGGALLAPRIGPRALVIGGMVATLPDFDSLFIAGDAIDRMTHHRGASHSFLVQTVAAGPLAWIAGKAVPDAARRPAMLVFTVWLCLVTHSMLDSLTTYGTQVFWPFAPGPPVAFPAVFIIDPVYSLLLLGGVLAIAFRRRRPDRGLRLNLGLLAAATAYLGLGLAAHGVVEARAARQAAFQGMRILAQPTPFNILFWHVLGIDGTTMATAYGTALPGCPLGAIEPRARHAAPPAGLDLPASVARLEWFTDGFYSYDRKPDALAITDLRLGLEQSRPFSFEIAEMTEGGYNPVRPRQVPLGDRGVSELMTVYAKAWRNLKDCLD